MVMGAVEGGCKAEVWALDVDPAEMRVVTGEKWWGYRNGHIGGPCLLLTMMDSSRLGGYKSGRWTWTVPRGYFE